MDNYFMNNRRPNKVDAANKIVENAHAAAQLMPVGIDLNEENMDRWPHRLVVDIAEAFIHVARSGNPVNA